MGVVGTPASGWKIAYASSATTGGSLAGAANLTPHEAWLRAAADVGRPQSILEIRGSKTYEGWTVFAVEGLADTQRVRMAALPTPTGDVRRVYETLYLDNAGGHTSAYQHYVDAQTGEIWLRKNIVEESLHHRTRSPARCRPSTALARRTTARGSLPTETIGSVAVAVEATCPRTTPSSSSAERRGRRVAGHGHEPRGARATTRLDSRPGTYLVRVCDFGDGAAWTRPDDRTPARSRSTR